jgi:hypothetical protein
MLAQQEVAFAANAARVGEELDVLADGPAPAGQSAGRHAGQDRVKAPKDYDLIVSSSRTRTGSYGVCRVFHSTGDKGARPPVSHVGCARVCLRTHATDTRRVRRLTPTVCSTRTLHTLPNSMWFASSSSPLSASWSPRFLRPPVLPAQFAWAAIISYTVSGICELGLLAGDL